MSEVKTPWAAHMGDVPMHLEYFGGSMFQALELVAQQYGVAFASNFRIEEHASADRISLFCFGDHPETWDFVAAFGKDYSPAPPDRYLIELIQSLY